MQCRLFLCAVVTAAALSMTASAEAQSLAIDYRWSADFGIGWDNSISGNKRIQRRALCAFRT